MQGFQLGREPEPELTTCMIDVGDEQPIAPLALEVLNQALPVDPIPVVLDQDGQVVQPARAARENGRAVPDAVVDDPVAKLILRRQRGHPMAAERAGCRALPQVGPDPSRDNLRRRSRTAPSADRFGRDTVRRRQALLEAGVSRSDCASTNGRRPPGRRSPVSYPRV